MRELKHKLNIEPYPYQAEGIQFGLEKNEFSLVMNLDLEKHYKV